MPFPHLPKPETQNLQGLRACDPFVIRVNAHGHAFSPTGLTTEEPKSDPWRRTLICPGTLAKSDPS